MTYRIEFRPSARRTFLSLATQVRERIGRRLEALSHDPRPPRCQALSGGLKGLLRVRVGDYRIIYTVIDDVLVVLVLAIGHRGKVYEEAGRST